MSTSPTDLHACLREATKGPHRLLDHHPLLAPLVRDDLTLGQYGDALAALYGVYASLEAGIDRFLATVTALFDYQSRRKLPALKADLDRLGRLPPTRAMGFPVPVTIAELVGILYAVEGTTLGAQHILRCLRQRNFNDFPMSLFSAYGEDTEARWQAFLAFAERACPRADRPAAVETAVSLFRGIKTYLDGLAGAAANPQAL